MIFNSLKHSRYAAPWLYVVPWGLGKILKWVKANYNNPVVYITENGMADSGDTLDDQPRIEYYKQHINNVLKGKCT